MIRRLVSSLADELAGVTVLYRVMRYRRRAPLTGPTGPAGADALLSGEATRMFGGPPPPADLHADAAPLTPREVARVRGCGGGRDFTFPSPDRTGWAENDAVRGRVWRAEHLGDRPRRAVIAVDGIVQRNFHTVRQFARGACPGGVDVVTLDLPFNHRRTPDGYRPGQLILGGDLTHVLGVLRQAVRDVAAVYRGLHASGEYPGGVGLAGVSFGGWTALQTAALLGEAWGGPAAAPAPRLACGVVPASDLLLALTDGGAIVRAARRNLGIGAADRRRLEPLGRSVRPAAYPRPAPPDPGGGVSRVQLHAARFDRFVPNAATERLAEAWRADLTWHPVGHMGLCADPRYLQRIARRWTPLGLWG